MNSTGNPSEDIVAPSGERPSLLLVVVSLVLVAVALFVASQIIGVLWALVFPALPPVPPGVTELEYEAEVYGVDSWLYGTSDDACTIVTYYEEAGGNCRVAPGICEEDAERIDPRSRGENAGRCTGRTEFSLFQMSWEANIATGYEGEHSTHFRVSREVFWIGTIPEPTPMP